MYLGLAIWCSVDPATTSDKVGFQLRPGSGQSEFFVIYGGLELSLALFFLAPLIWSEFLKGSLMACIVLHACLVVFRTISFVLYTDIEAMTYQLAIGEWVILILAVTCFALSNKRSASN